MTIPDPYRRTVRPPPTSNRRRVSPLPERSQLPAKGGRRPDTTDPIFRDSRERSIRKYNSSPFLWTPKLFFRYFCSATA